MKKWLLGAGVIIVLAVGYFILFFPFTFSRSVSGHCMLPAARRCFTDTARWADWWPKDGGVTYKIVGVTYDEVRISLGLSDGRQVAGTFRMVPLSFDSVMLRWVSRVTGYRGSMELGTGIGAVLDSFRAFVEVPRNIYGVNFRQTMSHDTTLATIIYSSPAYPTVPEVYRRVDSLTAYLASEGVGATGFPWLSVTRKADSSFNVMVAIPTNKRITGNGRIVSNRFVPWKMIEGDVYGGPHTVERAFDRMKLFKVDHNMIIIALPYQYLIMDRRQQPDTSKWVTRVCAPIT